MAHDVFISYSNKDKPTADAACALLESVGIRCWIAPRDIVHGMAWGGCIKRAIGQSRVMVLVLSSHSNKSSQVLREVDRAVNNDVAILPFRIEDIELSDDLDYYLSAQHWLDALTPPLEAHLRQLCQSVQALLPTLRDDDAPKSPGGTASADRAMPGPKRSRASPPLWKEGGKRAAVEIKPSPEPSVGFSVIRAGQTRKDNGLKTTLVWIPPGHFTMGSPKNEKQREDDEDQVHVTLTKGFWLGQQEVTQAEWQRVMHTKPWSGQAFATEGDNYPATYVSWDDAMKFCKQLSAQERSASGLHSDWQYTLPTEAQWEYACRAGTESRFSFGDDESQQGEHTWANQSEFLEDEYCVRPVGQMKPNPWGLYDVHWNASEWCRDWYGKQLPGGRDPQGPSEGLRRVVRSRCRFEFCNLVDCRSASRDRYPPHVRQSDLGFRVAVVPSGK